MTPSKALSQSVGPSSTKPAPDRRSSDPPLEPHDLLHIPDKKTIVRKAHLHAPSPLVLPPAVTSEDLVSPMFRTPSPPPLVLVAAAPSNHASVFMTAPKLQIDTSAPAKLCSAASQPVDASIADSSTSKIIEVQAIAEEDAHADLLQADGSPTSPAPTATPPPTPATGTANISIGSSLSMAASAPAQGLDARRHSFPSTPAAPAPPEPVRP
ncbi:hypothetical protein CC85DRAFT_282813 [Cutaneotrichosporon oleaginosum]|uniref:Uncharacterized protein n=1 Tax=Cutaneotrichosporon oleaginosum TaxID=879819 RepID=A0A0J0XW72_9TREE|nr:uncharacterized protein CC85DRAFT_282813 [Cutaneotrichosporon oleaginosum]KLT45326.1 hypothetical protein CC85DRAFT_282813 [Cutaneotrichosporon oleaginosum]TXT14845.1 hypothetical protein COLE_01038 [Cutaneotrichosporon oleaginosum]